LKKDEKKTVKDGIPVYSHVHHSMASENKNRKLSMSKSLLAYDLEQEKLDNMKRKKPIDADTYALELKYEKVFTELLKELGLAKARKMSPRTLLFLVEKRMEQKEQEKRIPTSERMLAFLKHTLMEINKFDSEEDKYDLKKFVSNVFGKYRARHEEDKEREKRILKLETHIQDDHNENESREEFHDQFFNPYKSSRIVSLPYVNDHKISAAKY